jgi:asparagine synthetase B (glutamine-hydrolysing)
MCGIFFSLCRHGQIAPDDNTARLLRNRGPDHTGLHQIDVSLQGDGSQLHATFLSTVLSLRGAAVIVQPLIDENTKSVLCWNGEAWSISGNAIAGNDSKVVFELLLQACSTGSSHDSKAAVIQVLSSIRGPYAIVYYDAVNNRIYYGRDCLGRRSLLRKSTSDGSLVLSSVCDNATGEAWAEVEADGIYVVDLSTAETAQDDFSIAHIPHARSGDIASSELFFVGRCSSLRCLLMSSDLAISTHEPPDPP